MAAAWRTVRLFISSTFKDMHAERDHLVRFVFPALREELLKRRIHFVDVDLRWGVVSENEEDSLQACREVINECKPRFLCMLGGRYGCVPPGRDISITADEVYYAALDATEPGYRFFYFRKPQVTKSMVERTLGEYREIPGSENEKKLTALQKAIIDAGYAPYEYPARWDNDLGRLVDLEEFGVRVHNDILASIIDEFGDEEVVDSNEFADENAAMEAFIEERVERFVLGSREELLCELMQFAEDLSGDSYLCLTGEPGSGKSAFLAYFYKQYTDNPKHRDHLVIPHFVGASTGSTNPRRTLRRLIYELTPEAEREQEITEDFDELRKLLPDVLEKVAKSHHVVLIIDAINQFDTPAGSSPISWFPLQLPSSVRVIASSLECDALAGLRQRVKPVEKELLSFSVPDARKIVDEFLDLYHKELTEGQRQALLGKQDAGNPLYLLSALENFRTLGTYEITERIYDLPGEVRPLFLSILKRLEQDPGFRDSGGKLIGTDLVRRFVSCLAVSRHGLSQSELAELLAPGNPDADNQIGHDCNGNVSALIRLLRPYLMYRGELLHFYHGQFREAVEGEYLNEETEILTAHKELAAYFRRKADPATCGFWNCAHSRGLGELPYHLEKGRFTGECEQILTALDFLDAKIRAGLVYDLLADYSLLSLSANQVVSKWRNFLQKHLSRLNAHPEMLVAVVNHEGFAEARTQVAGIGSDRLWLRTSPEPMPSTTTPIGEALSSQVIGQFDFSKPRACAIAPERSLAFCFERLGNVRIIDLKEFRETEMILPIERSRPLVFACAPDASSLVVFCDTGKADVYQCICEQNGWPHQITHMARFSYYLPEFEDPVVVWHEGSYWFQSESGALAHLSINDLRVIEAPMPVEHGSEMTAIVFIGDEPVVALRQGSDSVITGPGISPLRIERAGASTACACGDDAIAVAFSNGSLTVYKVAETLSVVAQLSSRMVCGALGWDGFRLLWLDDMHGFYAWDPQKPGPVRVQDNQEVFPLLLHAIPREWLAQQAGSVLLATTQGVTAFSVTGGGVETDGRLQKVIGGPVWRAVRQRDRSQWLLERDPLQETLLDDNMMGRLYCGLDGSGKLYVVRHDAPGSIIDLSSRQSIEWKNCPLGINSVIGDDRDGCWLADRLGQIHFVDANGHCTHAAKMELHGVHGANLVSCGDHLVWVGFSGCFFPGSGNEAARTFVFFKKLDGDTRRLEQIGCQQRHPREGLCVAICYDDNAQRLVTLWEKESIERGLRYLRIAPVEDYIDWRFRETEVTGLNAYSFLQAEISADGRWMGIVNYAGELSCLSLENSSVRAVLAASSPFTAVAKGPSGSEFWLVEAHTRIYKCALVGRAT